jgi:nitrite reductase/ring-hydroxylating ferredoxin subunit
VARLIRIGATAEIGPGQKKLVEVDGMEFLVCHAFGRYYALSPVCPHEDGPLQDGSLIGETVICPVHGYDFNIRTGECLFDPEYRIATYPVSVQGPDLYVELPSRPT